ncbi:MAG: glycosyltransferase family 4 protein [Planctomycetota bacterium]
MNDLMDPLRINFVLPVANLAGGVRVVAVYAERLAARGHHVTVVSLPRRLDWRRRLRRGFAGRGFGSHAPSAKSHLDGLDLDHRVLERFRPVEDADLPDADVTVATWWKTAAWVNELGASKGAKAYFLQHDERQVHGTAEQVIPTWRLPMHKILVAQWLEPVLRAEGITEALSVVPNAVDAAQFFAPPRGKQATPTVGLMYSDSRFKGVDLALAAYEKARERLPALKLIAFGVGDPKASLPLPAGAEYHASPSQEKLREYYGACDAWLFASRCEGFGLPILEAMACRTPVIATPAGAAPELVGQGGGVLVGPEDVDGMAAAILGVCGRDEADWKKLSDQAHATAAGYTWDDATERFEAALRRAVGSESTDQENDAGRSDGDSGGGGGRKELACTG